MSTGDVLLWIIFPYVAIAVFVVGHWWRYRHDQFRWTSRSTELLDRGCSAIHHQFIFRANAR